MVLPQPSACASVTVPGQNDVWSIVLALITRRPVRIAAQVAVLIAVVAASLVYVTSRKTVSLSIDGKTTQVGATSDTVEDFLSDRDVAVGSRDLVAPSLTTELRDGDAVVVRYARPLTLTVDGVKKVYWTTELSVDKALESLGVRADGAVLSASRSQRIDRTGLAMWLSTPKKVTLRVAGKKTTLTTTAGTVGDLLAERSLTVHALDKLSAAPSTPLTAGLSIKLTRIEHQKVTRTEAVAFDVTKRKNSSLYEGTTKVIKRGQKGAREAIYLMVVTNGKVSSKKLVTAEIIDEPVSQVVEVGTKNRPASSGGGSVGGSVGSLNWAALAKCESGGNPNAVNPAGYYGLYQFSISTWRSVGGSGKPTDYGSGEQTYRAQLLYKRTGASSWPNCGPRLFS
jgi:uncharacterized protein YabE (DUF348 family)